MQGTQQDQDHNRSDYSEDEDEDEIRRGEPMFGGDSGIPIFHGNPGFTEYITNDAEVSSSELCLISSSRSLSD